MAKKNSKAAPGQKGLTKEFATIPRQLRMKYEQQDTHQLADTHKVFVPGARSELATFVEEHSHPYDPTHDRYGVEAFGRDLLVHKHNKLYTMHVYWSKKDPVAIAEYVGHYTVPGDLVLDPFCGSGTTGCGSLLRGRNAVLIDPSPSACFLAHHYCSFPSSFHAEDALAHLLDDGRGEAVDEMYRTKCHRCGGKALIEFMVWSDTYQCPKCAEIVSLFECPEAKVEYLVGGVKSQKKEWKKRRVCPHCLKSNGATPHRDFAISTRTTRFDPKPVACKLICLSGCKPKGVYRTIGDTDARARKFLESDIKNAKQSTTGSANLAMGFDVAFPKGYRYQRDALQKFGIEVLGDLFTPRTQAALSVLLGHDANPEIAIDPKLYVTWILHKTSMLMGCGADGVGRINVGTYYIAPIRLEARPTKYLAQAKSQIVAHYKCKEELAEGGGESLVTNESALGALTRIPPDCVDYIFTDPPYTYKVQYGELNYPWEAILGYSTKWTKDEIIENPAQGKDFEHWASDLREVLAALYRVLKPGRWLSLCYHDTDPHTWTVLQDMLADNGFVIESVTALEPKSKSRNAITAEIVVKSDLVLNCQKPKITGEVKSVIVSELRRVSERVRDIIIEVLSHVGGQNRDRLWDTVLKRLLRRGQMAEHRFDDILTEVAFRSESGRWFLKEEFESLSQNDIKSEEDAGDSLLRFARLRCAGVPVAFAAEIVLKTPRLASGSIEEPEVENYIKSKLIEDKTVAKKFELGGRMKGVEFYDCLFFYLTRFLKGRSAGQTPRRNLAEFLEEYLVRFKDGDKWLYRVPDSAEADALRKSRKTGLGRRIRQYVSYLRGEGEFPVEKRPDPKTLFAWLKHCANFGQAEEGVLLFEKGGMAALLSQLPDEDRYDAEDYYGQCRRKASKPADEDDEEVDSDDADESDED